MNDSELLTLADLCVICGDPISDGQPATKLDKEPAHQHCADHFLRLVEIHEGGSVDAGEGGTNDRLFDEGEE